MTTVRMRVLCGVLMAGVVLSVLPQSVRAQTAVSPVVGGTAVAAELGVNPPRFAFDDGLGAVDRSRIVASHLLALQQVHLAIQYLLANKDRIVRGQDDFFNAAFGKPIPNINAVLQPVPVQGRVMIGGQVPGGGGQGGGGGQNQQGGNVGALVLEGDPDTQPAFVLNIRPGDFLFVGDPFANNGRGRGDVVRVLAVLNTGNNQGGGGGGQGGGQQNTMQQIVLDPNFRFNQNIPGIIRAMDNDQVFRIVRFEPRPDTTKFDRVVATFRAIRNGLLGFDPNTAEDRLLSQNQRTIQYNGLFTDFEQLWGQGVGVFPTNPFMPNQQGNQNQMQPVNAQAFPSLDPFLRFGAFDPANPGMPPTLPADRLLRQAGLSNSDSFEHLLNLQMRQMDPTVLPLLWTRDNDLPPNVMANMPGVDDLRPYYRYRQTIFGEPDNPFIQHVGRAFLNERIEFFGPFLDDSVASSTPLKPNDPVQNPNNPLPVQPGTGTPITAPTPLKQWQMIIESFAEHSTVFDDLVQLGDSMFVQARDNVAVKGLREILGDKAEEIFFDLFGDFEFAQRVADDYRSRDAANFARFAAFISSVTLPPPLPFEEPPMRRVSTGFNPVIPRF